MSTTTPEPKEPQQVGSGGKLAYGVTNLIKVIGAAGAVNELLLRTELRPQALAIIAFMLAGAQGLESLADRLLKR